MKRVVIFVNFGAFVYVEEENMSAGKEII